MDSPTRENVFETLRDLVYAIDRHGRLLQWNRSLEELTGLSANELRGRSALEFFAHHDRERVGHAIDEAFRLGFAEVEADLIRADGSLRPYQYTGVPLLDENGEVVGLAGVGRDISERRRAEQRSAALLDVARDSAGTLDLDELLHRVQRRTAECLPCDAVIVMYRFPGEDSFRAISHFGLSTEEAERLKAVAFPLIGPFEGRVPRGECVTVDDAGGFFPTIPRLKGVAVLAAPLRVHGRHLGTLVALRWSGQGKFTNADSVLSEGIAHQLALAMETAQLYRAQQEEARVSGALARIGQVLISAFGENDLLEQLCKATVEVLECDSSHTVLLLEGADYLAAVSGYGYPSELWESLRLLRLPKQWMGVNFDQFDATRQSLASELSEPSLRDLAATIGIQSTLAMPLRRGDKVVGFQAACYLSQPRPFSPLQQRIAGGISHLASLALEHARTLEELKQASRVKSEFVATMSHELRSPLNVILGYHGLLLEGAWGSLTEEQREILQRADRSASELLELITETLDLSRLEAGRVAVDLMEVSLREIVAAVESETRSLWERPGLEMEWEIPDDFPLLQTDPLKLKVVLKNLVANALKFTETGTVSLIAKPSADGIDITVSDTGIGIPTSALHLIFEPFQQADSSSSRRHRGVGLGLYIVRRLLDLLGGSISVESELGRGSIFRVHLPTARLKASPPPSGAQRRRSAKK